MPLVWGHRGASAHAPENTLAAFRLAAEQGADGVELDCQLSADGIPVVIHDETLDRTTNGRGAVKDLTAAELSRLDAGDGEHVPTLEEVFAALADTGCEVNVELKNSIEPYPGLERAVLDVVDAAGFADRVWFSSFHHYSMRLVRELDPRARVGFLYSESLLDPWRYARALDGAALHPYWQTLVIPGVLAGCRDAGVRTHAWTVNDADAMRQLLLADALITNHPDLAVRECGR